MAVDATSGAGGLPVDPEQFDAYYFAPQKCFGSDGGLWVALLSPAAQDRIAGISSAKRWVPASLDLAIALDNSKLDQTYNTPALATIFLFDYQVAWFNKQGGMAFSTGRCDRSAEILYTWAENSDFATPFVNRVEDRSHVVGTIDFDDSIDAATVAAVLRANGIVDTEPYRKLGRNQLRIALFPAIDPDDVASLCACINHVVGALAGLSGEGHPTDSDPRSAQPPSGAWSAPAQFERRSSSHAGRSMAGSGRASAPRSSRALRNESGSSPHDRGSPIMTSSSTVPSGPATNGPKAAPRGSSTWVPAGHRRSPHHISPLTTKMTWGLKCPWRRMTMPGSHLA